MGRTTTSLRHVAAGIVVIALLAAASSPADGKKRPKHRTVHTKRIAPGVKFTVINDPRGPWRIRIISIDLSKPSTIDVALATDELPGYERTSSMARRHRAIAAINGDYARPSGRPVFAFAMDGNLAQTPLEWGRNFAVDTTETKTFVRHPFVHVEALRNSSGVVERLDRLNAGRPGPRELAQFTSLGGYEEKPPKYACSARLLPQDVPHARTDAPGVEALYRVAATRCSGKRMARNGGVVLAAPLLGRRAPEVRSLLPNEDVTLRWTLGWKGVLDTIGGNPTLVERGSVAVVSNGSSFFLRHPRTGVGTTKDGRVLFITIDGRQPGYSVGMTPMEFARVFINLGAQWALNLDGGGSTTMVVDGEVQGRPSDGIERPVSSALLLLPGRDPGEFRKKPGLVPGVPADESPGAVWRRIVTDPASTGGMAASLVGERPLPRWLEAAARRFSRR